MSERKLYNFEVCKDEIKVPENKKKKNWVKYHKSLKNVYLN